MRTSVKIGVVFFSALVALFVLVEVAFYMEPPGDQVVSNDSSEKRWMTVEWIERMCSDPTYADEQREFCCKYAGVCTDIQGDSGR